MITTAECIKRYGNPNEGGVGYLESISLPYPMVYDGKPVNKMRCHRLVKQNFLDVFNEILEVYTYPEIVRLGIDKFGGCFNYRKMRGGTEFSRHSWGIAIDLHPSANALKTPYAKALFSKPEYAKLHEIFEKHGFENLGKVKGYDAMHWQIKSIV